MAIARWHEGLIALDIELGLDIAEIQLLNVGPAC